MVAPVVPETPDTPENEPTGSTEESAEAANHGEGALDDQKTDKTADSNNDSNDSKQDDKTAAGGDSEVEATSATSAIAKPTEGTETEAETETTIPPPSDDSGDKQEKDSATAAPQVNKENSLESVMSFLVAQSKMDLAKKQEHIERLTHENQNLLTEVQEASEQHDRVVLASKLLCADYEKLAIQFKTVQAEKKSYMQLLSVGGSPGNEFSRVEEAKAHELDELKMQHEMLANLQEGGLSAQKPENINLVIKLQRVTSQLAQARADKEALQCELLELRVSHSHPNSPHRASNIETTRLSGLPEELNFNDASAVPAASDKTAELEELQKRHDSMQREYTQLWSEYERVQDELNILQKDHDVLIAAHAADQTELHDLSQLLQNKVPSEKETLAIQAAAELTLKLAASEEAKLSMFQALSELNLEHQQLTALVQTHADPAVINENQTDVAQRVEAALEQIAEVKGGNPTPEVLAGTDENGEKLNEQIKELSKEVITRDAPGPRIAELVLAKKELEV